MFFLTFEVAKLDFFDLSNIYTFFWHILGNIPIKIAEASLLAPSARTKIYSPLRHLSATKRGHSCNGAFGMAVEMMLPKH